MRHRNFFIKMLLIGHTLLCLNACTFAQNNISRTGKLKQDINAMLPEGEIVATIMDSIGGSTTNVELRSSRKLSFSIGSDGEKLWFHTYDAPSILDSTSIDLERGIVVIDGIELCYMGETTVTDKKNSFNSRWRGHKWAAGEGVLNNRLYRFTLGQLQPSGLTFLHAQIKEIENGERSIRLDIPLLF